MGYPNSKISCSRNIKKYCTLNKNTIVQLGAHAPSILSSCYLYKKERELSMLKLVVVEATLFTSCVCIQAANFAQYYCALSCFVKGWGNCAYLAMKC